MGTAQTQTFIGMGYLRGLTLYLVYDNATGKIIKYGKARDTLQDGGQSMLDQCDAGQSALAVSALPNPDVAYAPAGALTARPVSPVTASAAGRVITIFNVPIGAAYQVQGDGNANGTAAESTLVMTMGAGGMYKITVTSFPMQDFAQSFTLT